MLTAAKSPATCGRGLKQAQQRSGTGQVSVARHVRAWIETADKRHAMKRFAVARHVRAWIET